jgi:hypothetical protein
MSPLMNGFQIGAWIIAIVGGLIAASKAITEMRRANTQRLEDMRWKRAEMAKKCLDEMISDVLIQAALKMLDWNGQRFDIAGIGKRGPISHQARREALRTEGTVFLVEGDEQFIRDAFDKLFDAFQRLEHFLKTNLIEFEDVEQPLAYYVRKLSRPEEYVVMHTFLTAYGYDSVENFLGRFPEWDAHRKSVEAP